MTKGDAPAWMASEDIIIRMKDELILQAVDLLREEIKAGRVDINGYVPLLPDKPNEIQRDMYIINNLVLREHEIIEQYRPFLEGSIEEKDPDKVRSIEGLRKFVLSVRAISTLMRLSEVAGRWADDTGKYSELKEPAQVLLSTARMGEDRVEVLDFVLSSSKFEKSEALTKAEMEMLRKVRKAIS